MNWQQVALAVIVGALIGYVTNWIAIRMLFRPLYEKKFMGLHVPFTPGVIPRGQKRLAAGIGDAVGGMLLTEEKVVRHLLQPAVEEQMLQYLSTRLADLRNCELTVGEALGDPTGESPAFREFSALLVETVLNAVGSAESRRVLAHTIADAFVHLLDARVGPTLESAGLNAGETIERFTRRLLEEEDTRRYLQQRLGGAVEGFLNSPKKINEYLPGAVREGIHQFIEDQTPRIVLAIEQYLSSPAARQSMKKRMEDFLEGTALKRLFNGVLQLLGGGTDMLTQRLAGEITRFLEDENNREEIIKRLLLLADEMLNKSVSEVAGALDEAGKREKASEIASWLVEKICASESISALSNALKEVLAGNHNLTWRELLRLNGPEPGERLVNYIDGLLEQLLERREVTASLKQMLRLGLLGLWQYKINTLPGRLPADILNSHSQSVIKFYRHLVHKQVPGLLRFLDISTMVRQRVEELDVLQVEQLLLGIMRRELVAITWLGALLGGVLGLVMVGMQYMAK